MMGFFAALRLPPGANVLVVPIPVRTYTAPLRWQADTGVLIEIQTEPAQLTPDLRLAGDRQVGRWRRSIRSLSL